MNTISQQEGILERFIPLDLEDLIKDLSLSSLISSEQSQLFQAFCSRYVAWYYAQAHQSLRVLKRSYQPFNPDRDTHLRAQENSPEQLARFRQGIQALLNDANYEELSADALHEALNKESPHGVNVKVDFDDFANVALFYRGSAVSSEMLRDWKRFSFKKRPVEILIYRRLFVLLQPRKQDDWIEHLVKHKGLSRKKAEKKVSAALQANGISADDSVVYLKLFKNIPRADLEMLFPNIRIQIRLFDKLKLGVMGSGGVAGAVMATISKFSAAIEPLSALMAIGGLLGVLWRQVAQIFTQRTKYSAVLSKNLYFYNLATNLSALTLLADTASAEECKEAILAYFFLWMQGSASREQLDKNIEDYILKQYNLPMDFEIDDGLQKLQAAGLLLHAGQEISVQQIGLAIQTLDRAWGELSMPLVPARLIE